MMNSIASASMSMSAAQFEQSLNISMTKKAMDTQEAQLQGLLEMLPQQAMAPSDAMFIDTYA